MKERELVVVVVTALALEFESAPVIVSAVPAALVSCFVVFLHLLHYNFGYFLVYDP